MVAVCLQTGVHHSGVDWKNLNSQRPPYTPQGAEYARLDGVRDRQLDMVLKRIENTPSSAPEFPYLVQTLAKNFDDFPEKPLDSGGGGHDSRVDRGYEGKRLFSNYRKGVSEFIGYTFKRESIRPAVPVNAATIYDPVNEKDLLAK